MAYIIRLMIVFAFNVSESFTFTTHSERSREGGGAICTILVRFSSRIQFTRVAVALILAERGNFCFVFIPRVPNRRQWYPS